MPIFFISLYSFFYLSISHLSMFLSLSIFLYFFFSNSLCFPLNFNLSVILLHSYLSVSLSPSNFLCFALFLTLFLFHNYLYSHSFFASFYLRTFIWFCIYKLIKKWCSLSRCFPHFHSFRFPSSVSKFGRKSSSFLFRTYPWRHTLRFIQGPDHNMTPFASLHKPFRSVFLNQWAAEVFEWAAKLF